MFGRKRRAEAAFRDRLVRTYGGAYIARYSCTCAPTRRSLISGEREVELREEYWANRRAQEAAAEEAARQAWIAEQEKPAPEPAPEEPEPTPEPEPTSEPVKEPVSIV